MSLTHKGNENIQFEKMKSLEGQKVRIKNEKEEFGGGYWVGTLEIIAIGNFVKIVDLVCSPRGFKSDYLVVHYTDWGSIEGV